MPVNADKPQLWKPDIAQSVDFYNNWFMRFAPKAYRDTRVQTTKRVESALKCTANLMNIAPSVLRQNPNVLPMLRMATAPPIVLFLCGYFDTGYLGYEAAEGIDWVWEHRIDDLTQFGV